MRRVLSLVPVAWLVLLLVLPVVAFLLGARQPDLENRPNTPVPDLNRGTLRRDATFRQLDQAILDRLPLRTTALDVRSRIAVDLFGDSTSPKVLLGTDHWLYYRTELRLCEPEGIPAADPADAVDLLARTLVASGRRAGLVVAGSKLDVHPQNLGKVDQDAVRCVTDVARRVHERLARAPGGIDLQAQLLALERAGTPTFLPNDTHFNAAGRELLVRAVLDRIRPGLAAQSGIAQGPTIDRPGDLGRFLGSRRTDRDPTVVATRTPPDPLPAGRVALVGDSQLELGMLDPIGAPSIRDRVLPGQPSCSWGELGSGACDAAIRDADAVVLEIVARNLGELVDVCWRPLAIAGERLTTGRASRWERTDGGPQPAGALRLDDGTAAVRIRVPGADVRGTPRLLRLPIRRLPAAAEGAPASAVTMAPEPQAGGPVPCATPSQAVVGGALFLPVPAGRPASDLVVRLSAPPGTVLGRPQQIVLDGRAPRVATR